MCNSQIQNIGKCSYGVGKNCATNALPLPNHDCEE